LSTLFIVLLVGVMVSSAFWQLLNFCSKVVIASRSNGKGFYLSYRCETGSLWSSVLKARTVSSQWCNKSFEPKWNT